MFCSREIVLLTALGLVIPVLGCGGGGPSRSPVKGTVKTSDGKVVDKGTVTFAPQSADANAPSAPVSAQIKSDGTFEVTGGAVVGKHSVAFEPAAVEVPDVPWDGKGTPPEAPPQPFAGLVPKTKEVDFAANENVIDIELVPATAPVP